MEDDSGESGSARAGFGAVLRYRLELYELLVMMLFDFSFDSGKVSTRRVEPMGL